MALPAQSEKGSVSSDSSNSSNSLAGYRSQILALAASSEEQVEDSDGSDDSLSGYMRQILALAGSTLENDPEHHAPHPYHPHYSVQDSAGSDSTEDYRRRIFDLAKASSSAIEDSVSDDSSAKGSSFHLDEAPYDRPSSTAQGDNMDCQEDLNQLSVLDRQEMSSMPLQFINTIYADIRSTKRCSSFYA